MNSGSRLFAVLLTIIPAVWGMCPCRILADAGGAHTHAAAAVPPCCPDDDPCPGDTRHDSRPSHPAPCRGCGLMQAGLGVVPPSPAAAPVPPTDSGFLANIATLDAFAASPAVVPAVAIRGTGPPLESLASVVLLI